jgi:hypothetical protein
MPATTKAPLGATTTNRKWYLDVNTGTTAAPTWVGVFGITNLQPKVEGSLQDDSDFDGGGWKSQTNSANAWSIEGKVKRGIELDSDPAVYDTGQEVLRLAAAATGVDNTVDVRWYEMEPNAPRVESYRGFAAVGWTEDGGGMDALSFASFTLTGQGERQTPTHPDA